MILSISILIQQLKSISFPPFALTFVHDNPIFLFQFSRTINHPPNLLSFAEQMLVTFFKYPQSAPINILLLISNNSYYSKKQ